MKMWKIIDHLKMWKIIDHLKMWKIIDHIKRIRCEQILSVVFIVIVICIFTATFPSTLANVSNYLNDEKADLISTKNKIDTAYRRMLEFKGGYLKNKGTYINLNGFMAHAMGQRYMNERVMLDNGNLTRLYDSSDMTLSAKQITKLYAAQKENGGYFLYVLAPTEVPKYEDVLPIGYSDYSNINADTLLDLLRSNDVPVLDLRDEMMNDGLNHASAFLKTDHHWTPETGFWAYTKILKNLIKNGVIEPVESLYSSIENYNIDVQRNYFLGSAGRRTGVFYAGLDDLSIITPKFDTNISLEIASQNIKKQGSFSEVALTDQLYKHNYFIDDPLSGYGAGYYGLKSFRNENAPLDLAVMCVGHSFSNQSLIFLSLVIKSLDLVDMQWDFKGDFDSYYRNYNPDIVIMLTYADQDNHVNNTYDFFNDQ